MDAGKPVQIRGVMTTAFPGGQRPGTSGLRKKTRVFMQPHYLENFVQAVFDVAREDAGGDFGGESLVVGGDGRYFNREAIQRIIRMAVANGFGRVLVARGGLLSTPAMSAVIRARGALGGLVLSASHNAGGIDADFGIKFNVRNGSPAPETITEKVYRSTLSITAYKTIDYPDIDIDAEGELRLLDTAIRVFDPLEEYTALMQRLFDFDRLRDLLGGGFSMRFDAMNGVTGPYATHILEDLLGAPRGTVIRGVPCEDFSGIHPDPSPANVGELAAAMQALEGPGLGAACDGDGDRNLIMGGGSFVSPGDSVAIIAEHAAKMIPGYREGLRGVARSMPTSTALDRVAAALGVACYETPTGWKFFGDLLDAGMCTICGEESFGTGSDHVREKDGIWAVLCWLSMLAGSGKSLPGMLEAHWRRFGRSYYQRHDYEGLSTDAAEAMMTVLKDRLPHMRGVACAGSAIAGADDFSYRNPVNDQVSGHGGLRVLLEDGSRIICRLSGTGTEGATLRMYLERYRRDEPDRKVGEVLAPLREAALQVLELEKYFGTRPPSAIT